ncbi:Solute carrier family 13 member 1 [Turdus rufiventris]|nr:Solute carrier family 13 member 1 [Turdus rufiventris]
MTSKEVASAYFKDFHLLLIGVICLATSIEKWNLHKRVALKMVMLVGVNPAWLTLGFMVSCAFLSMWLSNTSAAAMVMPIVEAVSQQIIKAEAEADELEMSYSNGSVNPALELDENIGECENPDWKEKQVNGRYPNCQCINFGSWFILSIPIAVTILLLSWLWLQWLFLGFDFKNMFKCGKKKTAREKASSQVIQEEYKKLGPIRNYKHVSYHIRQNYVVIWGFIPQSQEGLREILPPEKSFYLMKSHNFTPRLVSKLSEWVANKLTPLGSLPLWLIILISCLIVTSVTEVASNPATITIFLPILSPLAEAIHVNPLFILIPATLCTSFAFLLPVANPANAIVFSYGHLTIMDMVKAGLGINIIGVAIVMLAIMTWIVPIFDLYTYPSWAPNIPSTNGTGL